MRNAEQHHMTSRLQSENVTYCLHAVYGYIKLQSKQTYGIRMTDNWDEPRGGSAGVWSLHLYVTSTTQQHRAALFA